MKNRMNIVHLIIPIAADNTMTNTLRSINQRTHKLNMNTDNMVLNMRAKKKKKGTIIILKNVYGMKEEQMTIMKKQKMKNITTMETSKMKMKIHTMAMNIMKTTTRTTMRMIMMSIE